MPDRTRQRAERRDARANRSRIVEEAQAYFDEHGIDAPLHTLVKRIGIGSGTLYRHFPTHADLIRALYDDLADYFDELAAVVETKATGWEKIETLLDGAVSRFVAHPSTRSILHRQAENDPTYRSGDRFVAPLLAVVAQAHAEGSLRHDVTASDLALVPVMLTAATEHPEPMRSVIYARQRALVLEGLRATGAQPPSPAPAVSEDLQQLAHVISARRSAWGA